MRKILVAALALTATTACTTVDSEDLLTSGMSATMTVTALGDGQSRVGTVLRAGAPSSSTFVDLGNGDDLTVSVDGAAPVALVEYSLFGLPGYSVVIDDDSPETVFDISLTRTLDDGAPSSKISLPQPFDLVWDTTPTELSRAQSITFVWNAPEEGGQMAISASGDCLSGYTTTADAESGTVVIPANALTPIAGSENVNCQATFTFQSQKAGTLDTGFGEGGAASGIQQRSFSLLTTP